MAGAEVTIEIQGPSLQAKLEQLARATQNLAPFWRSVGEYMLRSVNDRFRSEQDPEGKAWAPLSAAYRRQKKGPKILTESGRLRQIAYRASAQGLTVGTNVRYAAIHQFGGEVKLPERTQVLAFKKSGRFMSRRAASKAKNPVKVAFVQHLARTIKIPARPFLGTSEADDREIVDLMRDHLERALGGSGA